MPPPAFSRSGAYSISPWCYVCTCVCAYVTFVTRFKFTCKFRCKFTSAFFLQLITFIPSGLESWNFVWHLPTSRHFNILPQGHAPGWGQGSGQGHPCTVDTFLVFFFSPQKLYCTYSDFWWVPTTYIFVEKKRKMSVLICWKKNHLFGAKRSWIITLSKLI